MRAAPAWSILIHLTLGTAAWAQGAGSGGNVNDCTFLKDPIELRNCILRFEGSATPPPAVIEATPPASPAEGAPPGAAPGAAAGESAGKPSGRRAKSRRARGKPPVRSAAPPRARDTPISIEQVESPPHAR